MIMPNTHWTDYIILAFVIGAAGCLSLIQIRKTFKFGPLKGMVEEMDSFDKKLLKIAGMLFLTFLLSLSIRLMV